jgi:drug/metabolite transporter (DMT)-like permease
MTPDQIAEAVIYKLATYYAIGAAVTLSTMAMVIIAILIVSYMRDRLQPIDWVWLPCFLTLIGAVMLLLRYLA